MPQTYEAISVGKRFAGVTVLDGVDFALHAGEVHALVGENGSGKSTLIRVLGGVHPPTSGHIAIDGEVVDVGSPSHARRAGLGIVHQDLNLFPELDVASNIAVGADAPRWRGLPLLDKQRMQKKASDVLGRLGLDFDPARPLRELGLADWKLVEIARALLTDVRFLILDEPTALLDRRDSRTVLATIDRLRSEGLGVAFVTHRLDEALEVADRFTVLRDGRQVAGLPRAGVTTPLLVDHIVGDKPAPGAAPKRPEEFTEQMVELRGVRLRLERAPFDLSVARGEILGLTGLIGAGALELARGLAGRDPLSADGVKIAGEEITLGRPAFAVAAGIGYVPEDRKEAGLVGCLPVEANLCLASLSDVSRFGFVSRRKMREVARTYSDELSIRAASLSAPIETLSGGNQQKVQIAKWLATGQRILVIESPTHGVDVGAKAEIHRLLQRYTAGGGTVIVASTDIPDVLAVADRIAVFAEGELVDIVAGVRSSHRELLLSGGGADDPTLGEIEELIAV